MKKRFVNGTDVYVHSYKDYTAVLYLNEENIINFAIVNPENITIATGDIFDDKHPKGLPNTSYYRKKIQMELEELLENQVFNIEKEITNEGE